MTKFAQDPLTLPSTQYVINLLRQRRRPVQMSRSLNHFQTTIPTDEKKPSLTGLEILQMRKIDIDEEKTEAPNGSSQDNQSNASVIKVDY
ncbi:MAG: hypothetical protein SFW66_02450 [Gammaproteobacteria bacterium]|nr:hypothetical protein [Gammaproteobacteria bacterium]